ncbi:MAG: discoidin domain-containing protein [Candidatus Aminicenantes bacterium]|nr:discoidin domain-containing protein [Candidatus Aminicenantes bacterium]
MTKLKKNSIHHFLPISLLLILIVVMTYPLILHLNDHLPSDLGDPLYLVWLIGHASNKIKEGLTNYWDGRFFYPHTQTVLYSDYVPALTFLGLLPALISKNFIFTYNFLWLLSFFLSGLGAYVLIYHLTRSRWASFIGSLIFTFSPVSFAHISHLELLFSAWLPFCFLFLHRFFEKPNLSNLSLALLFLAIQALFCGHYGLYAAFFMGLFGLILTFYRGFWLNPRFWLKTIIGIAISAFLLFPFFWPYFPVHRKMGFAWTFNDVRHYSAEIQNYLSVPPWNLIFSRILDSKAQPEHQVFLGFCPIILVFLWLIFNRFFYPTYKPFFIKAIASWLRFKKKDEKTKRQSIFIYILDIFLFILVLDIIVILFRNGFHLDLGIFSISSRRLKNPVFLFLSLLVLRYTLHPGWSTIKQKVISLVKRDRDRLRNSSSSFEALSPSDFQVNSDLYLLMALLGWLFSFGPVVSFKGTRLFTGPYFLLYNWVPGFKLMRVPSRFSEMVVLALSVLCGLALASFINSKKVHFSKKPFLWLIMGLILLEQISIPLPLAPLPNKGKLPEIYQTIAAMSPEIVLIELPLPENRLNYYQESLPMFYSIFHRHRIVNGYAGFIPPAYSIIQEAMEFFPSEATVALLRRLKVDLILVHTQSYRPQKGKEIVEALKKWTDQCVLIDQREGDFLYQLLPLPVEEFGSQASVGRRNNLLGMNQIYQLSDKSVWKVWSSSNVVNAPKAIDNSLESGWSTALPQKAGDFFWIDFCQEIWLSELRLYLKNKLFEYPRHFLVEISNNNVDWKKIAAYTNHFPYFDLETIEDLSSYHVKISFPPTKLRFMRLKLTAGHPLYHWSIQEIEAFGKIEN